MENPDPVEALFKRYLENKCTPGEVALLLGHFRAGNDETQLRQLIAQQLDAENADAAKHKQAVEEVYASLAGRISVPGYGAPVRPLIAPYLRNAAIWLLVLFSAGAALYLFRHHEKEQRPVATLHVGAAPGERKEVVLPDSSHLWLNAGSSVDYPAVFNGSERNVSLRGEAFFDVARDPAHPFVIRTGALRTRVLGTSFNIKAYPEDSSIAVSVVTGRVKVSSPKASMDLQPDQQAVYGKSDGQLVAQPYPGARALAAWREGKLQFRNRPLREVIRTLERRYAVSVSLDNRSRDCPVLHADFDDTEPVGRILEMLAVSLNGRVEKEGETGYRLTTGGCF
ncbi:MAG: FecR domain-containing protein [Dyadobacter sp.]|uniref:FecR family protein n=1 Tax=Dyadobacter sp. TaxID=1914288 RepID=UPI001B00F309|nr:FecR domain-containing protein [Dyadobacter sp.]MBO9617111.1 FecR domain-containing protein [Dyadobacter sp.]